MEVLRVVGGRPAGRRGAGHRREEQRAQADGGGPARRGHHDAARRARHPRRRVSWPSCCGGWAATSCTTSRRRTVSITVPEVPVHRADYDLVRACAPRSACSGRCSPAAARPTSPCPGGDNIGSPRPRHARRRPASGSVPRSRSEHGYLIATRDERLHGRHGLAGLPERRRHREPAHGGGAGRGHDRHRQRGARAGDRRHLPDAAVAMGAQIDGVGTSTLDDRGRRRAASRSSTPPCRTASSPARGRSRRR